MNDELVFKRAQKRDADSFYKLIEPIKGELYTIAYAYFKNENDAMDALSDSIVKAIKKIDKCTSIDKFNAWMSRIVVNTCRGNYKKMKRTTAIDISGFENELRYQDKEYEIDLYDALDSLCTRDKDLIVKRYLKDMSIKEISESNNVPTGTVKSGINRTLKKLKLILEGC